MGKIGWKCVIPQCTSNTKAPGHFFPKLQKIAKKWLDIISLPELNVLSEEDIQKCRICYLHFSSDAYIFSLNRRRLKHDAVPTLNLSHQRVEDISQPSTSAQDVNVILDNNIQLNEENVHITIEEEQHIDVYPQIETTPKTSRLSTHTRKNILGSVTRKNLLTPKARQLYNKTLTLRKQNIALQSNVMNYKQRLKYAKKFSNHIFLKRYQALCKSQKIFIDMQLRNIRKKKKIHFPTFCKNMKSALKSVCGKHASIFLENIGLS